MTVRPYVSFAEVKQRVPIPEVLDVLGFEGQFTKSGNLLTGACPLPAHKHGPEPNVEQFKIRFKEGTWLWHCFGDCQRGGDVVEFVKAMTGFDDSHVRFWFAQHFPERLSLRKPSKKRQVPPPTDSAPKKEEAAAIPAKELSQRTSSSSLAPIVTTAPSIIKPLRFRLNLDPSIPYLRARGLRPETIQRFGLGLCSKGLLSGYVAIPLFGYPKAETPLGYLGRWPDDDQPGTGDQAERPRYKLPPEFPRNHFVYGLAEALEALAERPLIVVEGPFKVCHLFQAGFPNTVATLGAHVSDEQAAILTATGRRIVLFFDGDQAGYQGMRTAAAKLITHTFVRVIKLPEGVEPDDLSPAELGQLLS